LVAATEAFLGGPDAEATVASHPFGPIGGEFGVAAGNWGIDCVNSAALRETGRPEAIRFGRLSGDA
jgi:hypothetical protein